MQVSQVPSRLLRASIAVLILNSTLVGGRADSERPPKFHEIYAVGDSLTDTGNLAAILGFADGPVLDLSGQPLGVVLADGRLSNGLLTAERLAGSVKFPEGAAASALGGNNYAIAGALANPDFAPFAPFTLPGTDLMAQTRNLLANPGTSLGKKDLVIVFIGANDVFSALTASIAAAGAFDAPDALDRAAANVSEALKLLSAGGARSFLVFGAPNIARAPVLQAQVQAGQLPPEGLTLARDLAISYNAQLVRDLRDLNLDREFSGKIWYFPTFSIGELIASPGGARTTGLTSNTPCAPELGFAQSCDTTTFWDFVHVSAAVHETFARVAEIILRLPALVRR